MRPRASSLPLPWCLATRSSPPMALEWSRRRASSSSVSFQSSALAIGNSCPRWRPSPRNVDLTESLTVASFGMGAEGGLEADAAVVSQLARVRAGSRVLERRGYDGGWTAEINHAPFLPLTL